MSPLLLTGWPLWLPLGNNTMGDGGDNSQQGKVVENSLSHDLRDTGASSRSRVYKFGTGVGSFFQGLM